MNNSTSEPTTNNGFDSSGFTYGIVFVVGLIFLLVSVAFACVRLGISRSANIFNFLAGTPPSRTGEGPVEATEQGLHHMDNSFESYPKLLYSEEQKGGSNISSSCSICLGDYKETDMLRLLPDCGHLYHLTCVDPWLRLHSTCPICRKSSVQAPQSSVSIGESAIRVV